MIKYLVSTGSLPNALNVSYYDYTVIPKLYSLLDLDGIELVFLPEWDKELQNYNNSIKITIHELTRFIKNHKLKVPSIHLNRDIGNLLSSSNPDLIKLGQKILYENLVGATELEAEIVVLHLWDTYSEKININELFNYVYEVSKNFDLKLTIENIPISDKNLNGSTAWSQLKEIMPKNYGFTLDLNWCSLYNNFTDLKSFKDQILNIHVQGMIKDQLIVPKVGNLNINSSLKEIKNNYRHYITLELNNPKSLDDFKLGLSLIK